MMKPIRIVRQMYIDIVKENNIIKELYDDLETNKDGITPWGWKWAKWVKQYGNWKI